MYCSTACKDAWHIAQDHARRVAARVGRLCARCGEQIPAERNMRAVTCSSECGVAWQNEKRSAEQFAKVRESRLPCARCGGVIPDSRRRGTTVYCSTLCKNAAIAERKGARNPAYNRHRLYGLTPDQFDDLRQTQGDRCAICGGEWRGKSPVPHVDHDHATGAVRGLLCGPCNTGLGQFGDDIERLLAAVRYLTK